MMRNAIVFNCVLLNYINDLIIVDISEDAGVEVDIFVGRQCAKRPHLLGIGRHRHVKVRQNVSIAVRKAGQQSEGGAKQIEQTHDSVGKDFVRPFG